MGLLYFRLGPWINGGKIKRTEILMFIGDLSKWPLPSFVPSILWDAVLWCDASPVCWSFHSFWQILTILFAERSGIPEFSYQIERKLIQAKPCYWALKHANWLVCTRSCKDLSFPRSYNPYLCSCQHRTGFGATYAFEKHMCSAFSNEPPHRIGSGATQTEPMYMQMAMRSTAEWGFGRPTSFACHTGHALSSMRSIYGQGGWHIKSTRKRSADLRSYLKTWR